jgi:MFS family permease
VATDIALEAATAPLDPPAAGPALRALLLLALTITSAAAIRGVFSPLQEVAKLDLGLSDFQMSLIQGVAASVPIAILSIPLGRMVDRTSRHRLLVAMAALWTVGSILTAFADGFTTLFLTRMLAGLGAVCSLPIAISMAADLCAPDKRGRSLLLLSLGSVVGGASAFALGGALFGALATHGAALFAGLAPWRAVHLIFGLVSAALLLPLIALREPVRLEVGEAGAALGPALRALWARRGFLLPLFIGQISVVMADTAATVWAAPVLTRDFHQQPAEFGGWMGLSLLVAGVFGAVFGGLSADFGHRSRRRGGILLGAVVCAALSVPAALFPIMPTVAGCGVMLALLLLAGAATGLITATAIAVLVPNEIRGVCLGAFIVISSIIGLGVAPMLVTFGSEALGGEAHLGMALAVTGVVTAVASLIAFVLAMIAAPEPIAG